MTDLADAAQEFRDLARTLRLIGEEDLRRELYQAISAAAKPIADEIKNEEHLKPYMPDRYAAVLSRGLSVTTHKRTGGTDAGVTTLARAPTFSRGGRKIRRLNTGIITHPVFGDRENWKVQTKGMRPGFFDDPVQRAAPQVREKILEAMRRVADKAAGRP